MDGDLDTSDVDVECSTASMKACVGNKLHESVYVRMSWEQESMFGLGATTRAEDCGVVEGLTHSAQKCFTCDEN